MILVNLSNQIGAGPRNISLNLIRAARELDNAGQITFLTTNDPAIGEALTQSGASYRIIPLSANPLQKLLRFASIQLLLIRLTFTGKYRAILAFGNFLLVGRARRKAVLMHHPYLVDDALLAKLPRGGRFMEHIKRMLFRWTLMRVDTVIVQSDYMLAMFRQTYPRYSGDVTVIPNPISSTFKTDTPASAESKVQAFQGKSRYAMLYASRFYPHKNHAFLIELARAFARGDVSVDLIVTLDPTIAGASEFLSIGEQENLPIRNIGEVSQQELAREYAKADAAIFPSRAETFGNPLVEAMRFALPVVAPRKGYALAVLGDSGIYYDEDDVEGCAEACSALFADPAGYAKACEAAYRQGQIYPEVPEWAQKMTDLVDG